MTQMCPAQTSNLLKCKISVQCPIQKMTRQVCQSFIVTKDQLLIDFSLGQQANSTINHGIREKSFQIDRSCMNLLITSLKSGCGRLVFGDFSLAAFGGSESFVSSSAPLEDTDGASGSLRISLVTRYHPAALSSVLKRTTSKPMQKFKQNLDVYAKEAKINEIKFLNCMHF